MDFGLDRERDLVEAGNSEQPEQAPSDQAVAAESRLMSLKHAPHTFKRGTWRVDSGTEATV